MKAPLVAVSLLVATSLALSACGDDKKQEESAAPTPKETMTKMVDKATSSAQEAVKTASEEIKKAADTANQNVKAMAEAASKDVQTASQSATNMVTTAMTEVEKLLPGDAEKGAKLFKKCRACHSYKAGDKHKIGPNLFSVISRTAGTAEGFEKKYSKSMKAYGTPWTEALVADYLENPSAFLKEQTGDAKAKSNMAFKLKKPQDRNDVAAYLATLK